MIAYESDRAVVHHADARDVLGSMSPRSVDLLVTDPPYGVDYSSNRRGDSFGTIDNDGAGDRDVVREVLAAALRTLGPNRHAYLFGPDDVLGDLKVSAPAELIWHKVALGAGDIRAPWAPCHERISFVTNKHAHAGQSGDEVLPARMRKGSVLTFPRPTGRNVRHPNEKPVPLLRELIESSSRAGDTVLDPFAGSGSTAVAAMLSGRRAVVIELDDRWLPLILDRIGTAERVCDAMAAA